MSAEPVPPAEDRDPLDPKNDDFVDDDYKEDPPDFDYEALDSRGVPCPPPKKPIPNVMPLEQFGESRAVKWLWPGWIPAGKITVLDGDPGVGKSLLIMDLAARVSTTGVMPDGSQGIPGDVLLITDEFTGDVVFPRLEAAGADIKRIKILNTVHKDDHDHEPFFMPRDLETMRDIVIHYHIKLLVIDPLFAFQKGGIPETLRRLQMIAEETQCAVVLVRHLAKNKSRDPLYRGAGPQAIIAAARSALLLARDPEVPERRVLAAYKNINGPLPASRTFTLAAPAAVAVGSGLNEPTVPAAVAVGSFNPEPAATAAPRLVWGGTSQWPIAMLLDPPKAAAEQDLFNDACRLLEQATWFQPMSVKSLREEAHQIGISDGTLRRAKTVLGLKSRRQGFGNKGTWYWYRADDPKFAQFFEDRSIEKHEGMKFRDREAGEPLRFPENLEKRQRYVNDPDVKGEALTESFVVNSKLAAKEETCESRALREAYQARERAARPKQASPASPEESLESFDESDELQDQVDAFIAQALENLGGQLGQHLCKKPEENGVSPMSPPDLCSPPQLGEDGSWPPGGPRRPFGERREPNEE